LPAGEASLSAPVADGDTAVALSRDAVFGVNLATGEQRWRIPRNGGSTLAVPAIAEVGGTPILLFTQGGTAEVSALVGYSLKEPDAPSFLWQVPLLDRTTTGVSVDGDTAYTADVGGDVSAIRIANEVLHVDVDRKLVLWDRVVPGVVATPPAVGGGMVVVVTRSRTTGRVEVDAIGGASHDLVWHRDDAAATTASAVTIDGDRVIVGFGESAGTGVLFGLGLKDGLAEWSTRFASPFLPFTGLPVADGHVLALGTRLGLESGLYRVDAASGRRVTPWSYGSDGLWSYEFDISGVFASPVVVGGSVVLAFDDGRMAAIDTATGVLVWRTDTGSAPVHGLAAAGGVVLASVGSRKGGIVAFENDPGARRLAEVSSSKPNWGRMLGNYGTAFVGIGVAAALVGILVRPRRRSGDPAPGDDDDLVDAPIEGEPA
jgi:outer membrane protein assembly factor BamB